MTMRNIRIFALLLAAALLLPLLVACGGGNATKESEEKKTERATESAPAEKNWWDDVDFGGETLTINVSVAQSTEQTFGPADVYSRGPDSIGNAKDNVGKMVYNRNRNVEDTLHLSVEWQETNQLVGASQAVLETFVKQNSPNSPDLFINDVYDLIHAMLNGVLWNLLDPTAPDGSPLVSYFDFENPCWYRDYMAGTTMQKDKLYVMTGDYFFDMIRYAYALYVNREMFDDVMTSQCITVHDLYEDVLAGYWDYDIMEMYIDIGFRDTKQDGIATREDDVVGLIASAHLERVFQWTSGISMIEWEDGERYSGKPSVPETNQTLFDFVDRFITFFNTPGIYYTGEGYDNILDCVVVFLEGRALFSLSMMGELESEQVRASAVNKGVLPMPKFNQELQSEYHTLVHDQAEIGCILNNSDHFSEASAYMQMANEQSVDVLKTYYEENLKLRYADDPDTKAMIDLIHREIGTPFDMILARLVVSGGGYLPGAKFNGKEIFHIIRDDALEGKHTFSSEYASSLEGWRANLEVLSSVFEELQ